MIRSLYILIILTLLQTLNARVSVLDNFFDAEKNGVTISPIIWLDNQVGVLGGKARGYNYASNVELDLKFNLEKICHLSGSELFINAFWDSGKNLSTKIGALYDVSMVFGGQNFLVNEIKFSKQFNSGAAFSIGRLSTALYFTNMPLLDYFISESMNGSPGSVFINFDLPTAPFATTGTFISYTKDYLDYRLGIFSANKNVFKGKYHGMSFSTADGFFLISQAQGKYNAWNLKGNLYLGGLYVTGDTTKYLGGESPGNYGIYTMWNQRLYNNSVGGGLSPFFTTVFAPKNRNIFPLYFSGGVVYEKISKSRDKDFAIFGISYSKFSSDLNKAKELGVQNLPVSTTINQDFESIIEVGYGAYFWERILFQPDVQYIIHPDGIKSRANALVLGIHLVATF